MGALLGATKAARHFSKELDKKISELTVRGMVKAYQKDLFIYLGFYVAFNTVQVISRRVVGRAEETSTYSLSGFCTVNCRPTASNYQLSHLRPCQEPNPGLRGGGESVTTLCHRGPSYQKELQRQPTEEIEALPPSKRGRPLILGERLDQAVIQHLQAIGVEGGSVTPLL